MGFFDNLVRSIESGGLEKAVVSAVDGFESKLDKAVDAVDKTAAKLDKPVRRIEVKSDESQQQV